MSRPVRVDQIISERWGIVKDGLSGVAESGELSPAFALRREFPLLAGMFKEHDEDETSDQKAEKMTGLVKAGSMEQTKKSVVSSKGK